MTGSILVVAEQIDGEVDPFSLQLIGHARRLVDTAGCGLDALLLGDGLDQATELVRTSGVDRVLVADSGCLRLYNPERWIGIIEGVLKDTQPFMVVMGYTFMGMEIAPALAIRCGGRLVSNCVGLSVSADGVNVIRPMYGGKVYAEAELTRERTVVISVERGALPAARISVQSVADVVRIPVHDAEDNLHTHALNLTEQCAGSDDLRSAEIIVAVGRGIQEQKNLQLIEEAAEALGAVMACSRPLVDNGWLPGRMQVGISGQTVRPKVYLACGISGANQHIAGMSGAQRIIAINNDASAPIFRLAHYGVVGDLFQVLPSLVERARALRHEHGCRAGGYQRPHPQPS